MQRADNMLSSASEKRELIQLVRPAGDCFEARELLEKRNLTPQDVINFVSDDDAPIAADNNHSNNNNNSYKKRRTSNYETLLQLYHDRRNEIRELASKLETGGSHIDEHGRLVPTEQPRPPQDAVNVGPAQLLPPLNPPLPPIPPQNNNINQRVNHHNNNNNDNGMEDDDEERRRLERDDREAAEAIARAVQRYRDAGVPEEDFVLLRVASSQQLHPHQPQHHLPHGVGVNRNNNNNNNVQLTFRRICFAVLAVSTAFVCIMLQTLPLLRPTKAVNPIFDKLLYELLHVRHFDVHAQHCPGLHRDRNLGWNDWLWKSLGQSTKVDCSDGVLHIPAQLVLQDAFLASSSPKDFQVWEQYLLGVNVSWFFPCDFPSKPDRANVDDNVNAALSCSTNESATCRRQSSSKSKPSREPAAATSSSCSSLACFRGIHDGYISDAEVSDVMHFGAQLIRNGGDHFDIYHTDQAMKVLWQRLPSVLHKLQVLLQDKYQLPRSAATTATTIQQQQEFEPVAFRVSAVAPMDGTDVPLYGMAYDPLVCLLNRTRYIQWMKSCKRRNELARYSLPWPFSVPAVRDTCHLMADMDADPEFTVLTSVFLTNGGGHDYRGGVSLYVDSPQEFRKGQRYNKNKMVRRGLTIDGSRGRIVVSSGGWENRRCRLPTRAGIRAELQIWWRCSSMFK